MFSSTNFGSNETQRNGVFGKTFEEAFLHFFTFLGLKLKPGVNLDFRRSVSHSTSKSADQLRALLRVSTVL